MHSKRFVWLAMVMLASSVAAQTNTNTNVATNAPAAKPKTGNYGSAAMREPAKSVFENYLKIGSALAEDSTQGVAADAAAIGKAIRADEQKLFSAEVAAEADTLAKAADLAAMREAFKALTESLITYLADHDVRSQTYIEVYCPMADATWLQKKADDTMNPFLGKSMQQCGTIRRTF